MNAGPIASGMALKGVSETVQALYGIASDANEFFNRHIDKLKSSDQPALAAAGRLLEAAKTGFGVGYGGSVAVVVVGQLILGHPLTAGIVLAKSALLLNPVAVTCGAIGAIYFGWSALQDEERSAIIGRVVEVLGIAADTVRALVQFVLTSARKTGESWPTLAFKESLIAQAQQWGHALGDVTRSATDRARDLLANRPPPGLVEAGDDDLTPVVERMRDKELRALLAYPFKEQAASDADEAALRLRLRDELSAAGSSSLPFMSKASYGQILVMVAEHLEVPVPLHANAAMLEHFILFKVLLRSIENMDEQEKQTFVTAVESDLRERGVSASVSLDHLLRFVKTAGMDVGGSLGTLLMGAPGFAGLAGLNILQFAVLKGILITSGYFGAATAVLGFGTGGALMAVAGAAGPVAGALMVLYTVYKISGPAYRKLIPAVCAVAAKRIEMESLEGSAPPVSSV